MIKIKLQNRTYKMPKRWTIQHWKDIMACDMDNPLHWAKIMSIGFGEPYHKFTGVSDDSLLLGASLILNRLNDRLPVKMIDFTTLNFGQWVDLDIWFVNGIEKHLDEILETLTTKKIKYIDEAFYVIDQYSNFRISTYRSYSGLFGLNDRMEQEDGEQDFDPQQIAKGWYKIIVDLSDNNLSRIDQTTEEPLYKTLSFMSLRKERQLKEEQQKLKQQRRNDLSRNR